MKDVICLKRKKVGELVEAGGRTAGRNWYSVAVGEVIYVLENPPSRSMESYGRELWVG